MPPPVSVTVAFASLPLLPMNSDCPSSVIVPSLTIEPSSAKEPPETTSRLLSVEIVTGAPVPSRMVLPLISMRSLDA